MKKAALIGAGEIGRAIGSLLKKNEIDHLFWDKDPERSTGEISDVLSGSDAVFFCVPSWGLREAVSSVKSFLTGDEILVFISKGLEPETGMNALEIAGDAAPEFKHVFIGGPMIAEEILSDKGGAALITSVDRDTSEIIKKGMSSDHFSVSISDDVKGVVFASVLKNIYAIAIGASEGFGCGVNIKGYLITEILSEMGEVIVSLGGEKDAAFGLAGLGDLLATASGPLSSNWSAGFSFAKKEEPKKISEGMSSFVELHRRLGDISKFKIMDAVGGIMDKKDTKSLFDGIIFGR